MNGSSLISDQKLKRAIIETKEFLQLNRGYVYEPDDDYDHDPDDEDALEELMSECGLTRDGDCLLAGTEYCDFECPFN